MSSISEWALRRSDRAYCTRAMAEEVDGGGGLVMVCVCVASNLCCYYREMQTCADDDGGSLTPYRVFFLTSSDGCSYHYTREIFFGCVNCFYCFVGGGV